MPGSPDNTNAVKHGARSRRNGIVLAALAKQHGTISVDLRRLKRLLMPYVANRQGAENIKAVALVNQICRWEMTARIMQKTIATDKLDPTIQLNYLNSIGQATARRDALLNKLLSGKGALDAEGDPWAALDAGRAVGDAVASVEGNDEC